MSGIADFIDGPPDDVYAWVRRFHCAKRPNGPDLADSPETTVTPKTVKRANKAPIAEPAKRGRPRTPRAPIDRRVKPSNLEDQALLERALRAAEPTTDAEFAETVLYCNPRTLRKYREGRPINRLLREKLETFIREKESA